jgi:rubrerythrin
MAELTALESKLGEVIGLAMAAQGATQKIAKLVEEEDGHEDLARTLQQMGQEAKETEERTTELAGALDGKKTAILEKARETKQEATEMMSTYLGDDPDALDGFEFLTMAEAGEVGHWEILGALNERARRGEVSELVDWALPIQKRHLDTVRKASLELASEEDPNETSS